MAILVTYSVILGRNCLRTVWWHFMNSGDVAEVESCTRFNENVQKIAICYILWLYGRKNDSNIELFSHQRNKEIYSQSHIHRVHI